MNKVSSILRGGLFALTLLISPMMTFGSEGDKSQIDNPVQKTDDQKTDDSVVTGTTQEAAKADESATADKTEVPTTTEEAVTTATNYDETIKSLYAQLKEIKAEEATTDDQKTAKKAKLDAKNAEIKDARIARKESKGKNRSWSNKALAYSLLAPATAIAALSNKTVSIFASEYPVMTSATIWATLAAAGYVAYSQFFGADQEVEEEDDAQLTEEEMEQRIINELLVEAEKRPDLKKALIEEARRNPELRNRLAREGFIVEDETPVVEQTVETVKNVEAEEVESTDEEVAVA